MKTNLDKIFKTSKAMESEGVKFVIEGVSFHCRRFHSNSPHVRAASMKHLKPVHRQLQQKTLSQEESTRIDITIFVESAMIGWEGLLDGEGKEIEFSTEAAIQLFTSLPDLYDTVINEASTLHNFIEEDKKDLGNF